MTRPRGYYVWRSMKKRCDLPGNQKAKYYYDKGITYDPRWKEFRNFIADMGEPPEGLTLERLDGNKGYYKDNCKWATYTEQNRNREGVKLTEDLVREIKKRYREGGISQRLLGREYGIAQATVSQIVNGQRWGDISCPEG